MTPAMTPADPTQRPDPDPEEGDRETPGEYRARDVRQGQIILRKPWMRWTFGGGLCLAIVFAPATVWVLLAA